MVEKKDDLGIDTDARKAINTAIENQTSIATKLDEMEARIVAIEKKPDPVAPVAPAPATPVAPVAPVAPAPVAPAPADPAAPATPPPADPDPAPASTT